MSHLAILLDQQTVAVIAGGKMLMVSIADLGSALEGPTNIAVVPTETLRVVATSEDGLNRQVLEKMPAGSVYCSELLEGAAHQVFFMPADLLKQLRAHPQIEDVVPYAVAAREGSKSTIVASTFSQAIAQSGLITRAGRAFLGVSPDKADAAAAADLTLIDFLNDRPIIVCLRGAEVKAVRALHADADLDRELMLTLQGASMPNSPVVTSKRSLADKLREAGRDAKLVRLPPDTPTIGLHGMRKPLSTLFCLPEELAKVRRRQLQRKVWRTVVVTGMFAVGAIALATFMVGDRILVQHDLDELRHRQFQTSETHTRLFRERYASIIAGEVADLPQAWAELDFMLPPQLEVEDVILRREGLSATLRRRTLAVDERDPPLSLKELKTAVARMASWKGANVKLVVASGEKELKFSLEKRLEPSRP